MFKVFCQGPIGGTNETFECEYTGNRYATYDEAKPELMEAREHPGVLFAWIAETE